MEATINQPDTSPDELLFKEAYEALLPKFRELRTDEIEPINLDIPASVTTALGVAPEVAALRERVEKELPQLDFAPALQLDRYAMALSHAHARFLVASQPVDAMAWSTRW